MSNLAICLQVWEGDVFDGLRLTQLICSIEKEKRDDIVFILAARRGTNDFTCREIQEIAASKFSKVFAIQGKRYENGWPSGPNGLWQETMMRIGQMRQNGRLDATGVLTFEADCIPLRPDWLNLLSDAWEKAHARGKKVLGHAHTFPGKSEPEHINGNAIFETTLVAQYPELQGCDATVGWDYAHGKLLLSLGEDTPLIYQRYRIKDGFDQYTNQKVDAKYLQSIQKDGITPALYHGLKGHYGMEVVEQMIQDGSFFKGYERTE